MGGVIQQVNLYRESAGQAKLPAGVRLVLVSGVVAMLAVVALAVTGEFYLAGIEAERDAVAEAMQQRQQQVEASREAATALTPDPHLAAELERLGQTRRHLMSSLVAVSREQSDKGKGFAAFFAGLGRNATDGIWFRRVKLAAGGAEVVLNGQTLEPALVPRFLQTLAVERAFEGLNFRDALFERRTAGQEAIVDFELRTAIAEEGGDAG
ncbi:MAG: hypothetical protein KDI88_06240 [Gammaproteobacteria bacterium]|nr:hypothetical protein [Gammaproteobacteria bacterium]